MDPWVHAERSARTFGGEPGDYVDIHLWFDDTKKYLADFRHRALRHHAAGVAEAVERFGPFREVTGGKRVPVRQIAEQHVTEDVGRVPTVQDWLSCIRPEPWMNRRLTAREREIDV